MLNSYLQSFLDSELDREILIPNNWCPNLWISVKFDGFGEIIFTVDNPNLNRIIIVAGSTLKGIILSYKNTHVFDKPQLSLKPSGELELRIGLMDIELYEEIKKSEESVKSFKS